MTLCNLLFKQCQISIIKAKKVMNNFYPQNHTNFFDPDNPIIEKLKKESELIESLNTLYFKVIETNPGDRFIRRADPKKRGKKAKGLPVPFKTLEVKSDMTVNNSTNFEIKTHKDVASFFLKNTQVISINENLKKYLELPVVVQKDPEIEEQIFLRLRNPENNTFFI